MPLPLGGSLVAQDLCEDCWKLQAKDKTAPAASSGTPVAIHVEKHTTFVSENGRQFFWLDGHKGEAMGGYYIRNNLKESVDKFLANGLQVVGFVYDGSYNLELITAPLNDEDEDDDE